MFTANGENKGKKIDGNFLGLRKWGYVFYTDKCLKESCKVQLILHGCMMDAEEMVKPWAPMAFEHDLIMVFPQAVGCWDNMAKTTGENTYSREGP